jgi:hypothetical protein
LCCLSAGCQHRGHRRPGGDTASGHQRRLRPDGRPDPLQQGQQPQVGRGLVVEAAAVAAGLVALHDQGVGAGPSRGERFVGVGDRYPDADSGLAQPCQVSGRRAPEGEGDHRNAASAEQVELVVVGVLVPAWLPQFDTAALGVAAQGRGVGPHRCGGSGLAGRGEEIHAERGARRQQGAQLVEVGGHRRGAAVAGGQEAQTAGTGDSRGQRRRRGAARHRRLDDGMRQSGQGEEGHVERMPKVAAFRATAVAGPCRAPAR